MKKILTALPFALLLIVSCEKEPQIIVETPTYYDFERNGESSVSFSGQTTRIKMSTELISAMKSEDVSATLLLEMFANASESGENVDPFSDESLNNSSKSVKSKVAASADFFSANTVESNEIKSQFETWLIAQIEEVFQNANQIATPGQAGQIADGSSVRYVNGKGIEYDQAVNKSLIGALMVDQIVNNYLSDAVLDAGNNIEDNNSEVIEEGAAYTTMEHKWDEAYGYLFGNSENASDPLLTLGMDDNFLNKYLGRVNTDPDFEGIAQEIFDAFKLGRAAIVAEEYDLRDDQAEIIRENLSKVIAVRAVHYMQSGKNAIPTDGDHSKYGGAFHDLSEGYGFVYSLRFTRKPGTQDPYFTKTEVDGFLNQLEAGNGLWDVDAATLDSISDAIAAKFDFTVDQAAD